ncbi:MAG: deoxyhypusine synthase [Candidatus Altiarchaeota archaeon]
MDEVKDVSGLDNLPMNDLADGLAAAGFQASNLVLAKDLLKTMKRENCKIFLSFTANMIASGLRGCVVDLIKKGYVDAIITTGGSIDHDIIRANAPYLIGDFNLNDVDLHKKNINRLGNILIPNDRYELLEKILLTQFKEYYETIGKQTTPSKLISFLSSKIEDKNSFLFQCHKHNIPVFCPGITDAAVGLQLYFFTQDHKDFVVDVAGDLAPAIDLAMEAKKTGAFILGGGIAKHHTLGVNLLRGGLDYTVYVTTASAYDGSLSGAETNEAKSWGKIKEESNTATVIGDATIIMPLIVAGL